MKFENGQSDSSSNEWSPLQPGAEAASGSFDETGKTEKKDKDSKKKSSTAITPEDVARAFGGKGKEWRQKLDLAAGSPDRGEAGHSTELPEGLIWLRAASTVQQQRQQAEAAASAAPDETVAGTPVRSAEQAHDQTVAHTEDIPDAYDQSSAETKSETTDDTDMEPAVATNHPAETAGHNRPSQPTAETGPLDPRTEAYQRHYPHDEEPTGQTRHHAPYERPSRQNAGQPGNAPEAARPADVPPLPPDPMQYRHFFWNEQPSPEAVSADSRVSLPPVYQYEHAYEMAAAEAAMPAVATAPAIAREVYPSPTPPGLQRSAAEVSRAAWFGLGAGWFFGRRNKQQAVRKAHSAGIAAGRKQAAGESSPVTSRRLEAEPLHSYPQPSGGRLYAAARNPEAPASATKQTAVTERAALQTPAESAPTSQATGAEQASSVRSMGKRELLRVAKTIRIEGISLKDVFNAKRIDEAGMRSVVETYLRGGDVRQKLTQEVIAKEKSFEVDPLSRQYKLDNQRQAAVVATTTHDAAPDIPEAEVTPLAGGTSEPPAQTPKQMAASSARRIVESGDSVTWLGVTAVVIIYSLIVMLLA